MNNQYSPTVELECVDLQTLVHEIFANIPNFKELTCTFLQNNEPLPEIFKAKLREVCEGEIERHNIANDNIVPEDVQISDQEDDFTEANNNKVLPYPEVNESDDGKYSENVEINPVKSIILRSDSVYQAILDRISRETSCEIRVMYGKLKFSASMDRLVEEARVQVMDLLDSTSWRPLLNYADVISQSPYYKRLFKENGISLVEVAGHIYYYFRNTENEDQQFSINNVIKTQIHRKFHEIYEFNNSNNSLYIRQHVGSALDLATRRLLFLKFLELEVNLSVKPQFRVQLNDCQTALLIPSDSKDQVKMRLNNITKFYSDYRIFHLSLDDPIPLDSPVLLALVSSREVFITNETHSSLKFVSFAVLYEDVNARQSAFQAVARIAEQLAVNCIIFKSQNTRVTDTDEDAQNELLNIDDLNYAEYSLKKWSSQEFSLKVKVILSPKQASPPQVIQSVPTGDVTGLTSRISASTYREDYSITEDQKQPQSVSPVLSQLRKFQNYTVYLDCPLRPNYTGSDIISPFRHPKSKEIQKHIEKQTGIDFWKVQGVNVCESLKPVEVLDLPLITVATSDDPTTQLVGIIPVTRAECHGKNLFLLNVSAKDVLTQETNNPVLKRGSYEVIAFVKFLQ